MGSPEVTHSLKGPVPPILGPSTASHADVSRMQEPDLTCIPGGNKYNQGGSHTNNLEQG